MITKLRWCTRFIGGYVKLATYQRPRYYCTSTEIDIVEDHSFNFADVPVNRIRNFSIIAHVDHGKSTLADRLLEMTGAIASNSGQAQVLDSLQVEKERGITVKAQSASLLYRYKDGHTYLLNLIDTPGHVDFSNEVTRSLSACEGVILLVDANQGVQAQTVANYHLAVDKGLVVVPVLNKIDLKNADPDRVCIELSHLFDIDPESVMRVSAKLGIGIKELLDAIVCRIPAPEVIDRNGAFRALLFDSWFDRHRGALNLIYVKDGSVSVGDEIQSYATEKTYVIRTLSILRPHELNVSKLNAGQVGLVACNMKHSKDAVIGDTLFVKGTKVEQLPGLQSNRAMVFAGIFPENQSEHVDLRNALDKLILNDSAVTITPDSSPALGQGWRLGFLGLLHMDVFCQRLTQEYDIGSTITAPSVTYKLKLSNPKLIKDRNSDIMYVSNPLMFPDPSDIEEYFEPCVLGTIITPKEYIPEVIALCVERRSERQGTIDIDENRVMMTYTMPLSEIVIDFHDELKAVTSGYASFDYEDKGYQSTKVVKLCLHLNQQPVDEFSRIVHISKVNTVARDMVNRLKELIPKQMIQVAIQAVVGSKVLARETIKAYRKDVAAKLYGGDVTRRMKLIRAQAEGKRKMRAIASVKVPHDTYIKLLKR
ncbi:translation factor waclaw, mitochondrial [Sitodiplosis mosellana]|uniref:translation factor waclaw, mitochondrial n=1 Tax=Sitodiplosis mosellana TaxID=263140 RepID=UPI002444AA34|nr:translation factor waclaw, mitochondrial [Sitodiplosis mosellana]